MEKRNKQILLAAAVLTLVLSMLNLLCGAVAVPPAALWRAMLQGPGSMAGRIFWYMRLPRTAACLLAGAGLAVSGAVIQNVLANKLASPGILGVNAGAGLAVTLCCAFGALSGWMIAFSAFLGAVCAALLILLLARKTGASRTTVILGGVAVNSILNALSEAVTTLDPELSMLSVDFRVGGFDSVAVSRLLPAGVLIVLALGATLSLCGELDILALGADTARGLGLPVRRMRTVFLVLAALLAGASVSFAGLLGFVGLIVPHIARRFVGGESRLLLPLCAVGGAGFVTLCDLAARLLFAPFELPVGILLSILGGPFFLVLLVKKRGGRTNA